MKLGFASFEELENDGKVTVATPGINSFDTALIVPIEEEFSFQFNNIPYNDPAERYASLQGGFVDSLFEQIADKQFVESGKFNPVLVYHDNRVNEYPNMPTAVEVEEWKKFNDSQLALPTSFMNSEIFNEELRETYSILES